MLFNCYVMKAGLDSTQKHKTRYIVIAPSDLYQVASLPSYVLITQTHGIQITPHPNAQMLTTYHTLSSVVSFAVP